MKGQDVSSDRIAAEAVGERPGSATPDFVTQAERKSAERSPQELAASVGPRASMAERTAESIGERVGAGYAGATVTEAEQRAREVAGYTSTRRRSFGHYFDRQMFTALIAFAAGYAAALLVDRARSQ